MKSANSIAYAIVVVLSGANCRSKELNIVVPNEFANAEGNTSAPREFAGAPFDGVPFWFQVTYDREQFSELEFSDYLLTGIAFRPDHTVAGPQTVNWLNTDWRFSASGTSRQQRTATFADNHGPLIHHGYWGDLILTTEATGPENGPKDFDYRFLLKDPFFYNPENGHLVIEGTGPSGYSPALVDDQDNTQGGNGQLVSLEESPFGIFIPEQLILELTFVPVVVGDSFPLDGDADIDDLNQVRNNFGLGTSGGPPVPGDTYPFDGLVNIDDLNRVRNNFGAGAAPVPEPTSLALAVVFSTGVFLRRRHLIDFDAPVA